MAPCKYFTDTALVLHTYCTGALHALQWHSYRTDAMLFWFLAGQRQDRQRSICTCFNCRAGAASTWKPRPHSGRQAITTTALAPRWHRAGTARGHGSRHDTYKTSLPRKCVIPETPAYPESHFWRPIPQQAGKPNNGASHRSQPSRVNATPGYPHRTTLHKRGTTQTCAGRKTRPTATMHRKCEVTQALSIGCGGYMFLRIVSVYKTYAHSTTLAGHCNAQWAGLCCVSAMKLPDEHRRHRQHVCTPITS